MLSDKLVREEALEACDGLTLMRPADIPIDLAAWARANEELIRKRLVSNGGILFRGFSPIKGESLRSVAEALCGDLMEYTYRSTPRTNLLNGIYTSTEYPADQKIVQHNENSYALTWPARIAFFCVLPSLSGGETPTSDSRKIFNRIEKSVRDRFMRAGVMYVRNYGDALDLRWEEVFQTSSRERVEAICRNLNISFFWKSDGGLRTTQICQAAARHPVTGEIVWFNQAHLFHLSALPPATREYIVDAYGAENVPRNALYGDGTPIEDHVIAAIRSVYDDEDVSFPWMKGDVLLLDNMLRAHGREPFQGDREIRVAMGGPVTAGDQTLVK